MQPDSKRTRSSHLVLAMLFFALMTTITVLLLVTALAVWLTELIGSLKLAALIVGAICAIGALVIYLAAIRKPLDNIRDQAETIYEVAQTVKRGYEWVTRKVELLLRLRDELFGK